MIKRSSYQNLPTHLPPLLKQGRKEIPTASAEGLPHNSPSSAKVDKEGELFNAPSKAMQTDLTSLAQNNPKSILESAKNQIREVEALQKDFQHLLK